MGATASLIPLLVKVVPLRRLVALLTPPAWWRPYAGVPAEGIAGLTARRLRRPRVMRRRACLREGLTMFHFLRLAGLPATLYVGVYPPSADPSRLHGHCWVSLNGACVSAPPARPVGVLLRHGEPGSKGDAAEFVENGLAG